MIHSFMGDFHERKVLATGAAIGFIISLMQANPLNGLIVAAATIGITILGDVYWCGKEPIGYKITDHAKRLGYWGGLILATFVAFTIPVVMLLIGGVLLFSLFYNLYRKDALNEEEIFDHWTTLLVGLIFLLFYLTPELFFLPIIFLFFKFVMIEWPDGGR